MFTGILIATTLGFVAIVVARNQRIVELDSELKSELKVEDYQTPKYFIGGIAAVSAYDAFHAISMIDDRVLQGLDFSTKTDISTFNNLHERINEQFLHGSTDAVTGSLARLQGYVAEQIAAANLVAQGHVVEFPDTANNPGWDLLVEGHPFQVKDTLSPQLITEHFSKYPDIPVITNAEMAGHFDHNPNVHVDPNLSHDVVADHVHNTVEGINGIDGLSFHIPMITLALSGFRETKLLIKGNTDFGTMVKHVGLDVAGVAGGGLIGKMAGAALVGSFAGPVGAAIGAVAGAIGGAIFGRMFTNSVKMMNYENAVKELNDSLERIAEKLPEVIDAKVAILEDKADRLNKRMGVTIFDRIWPSRRWLVAREVKRRLQNFIGELQEKKQTLLDAEYQYSNGLSSAGTMAYNLVTEGGYYYPEVKEDIADVNEAVDKVHEERKKLGG